MPDAAASARRGPSGVGTAHAAKGLEFGRVVLSGMTAQPRRPTGMRVIWPPAGGYAVRLTKGLQTNDFEAALPVDEQMDANERIGCST